MSNEHHICWSNGLATGRGVWGWSECVNGSWVFVWGVELAWWCKKEEPNQTVCPQYLQEFSEMLWNVWNTSLFEKWRSDIWKIFLQSCRSSGNKLQINKLFSYSLIGRMKREENDLIRKAPRGRLLYRSLNNVLELSKLCQLFKQLFCRFLSLQRR